MRPPSGSFRRMRFNIGTGRRSLRGERRGGDELMALDCKREQALPACSSAPIHPKPDGPELSCKGQWQSLHALCQCKNATEQPKWLICWLADTATRNDFRRRTETCGKVESMSQS